jgi:uncharacterized protein YkwD
VRRPELILRPGVFPWLAPWRILRTDYGKLGTLMAAAIRLVLIGSDTPRVYPLVKKRITIGSAPDNDIVIQHESVSRTHAVISRRFGRFRVHDLSSTNGTRVNGHRGARSYRFRPGDELQFGKVRFAAMNSPRARVAGRGRMAMATAAVLLLILGFGFAQYLRVHPSLLPWIPVPMTKASPAHTGVSPQTPAPQAQASPLSQARPEAPAASGPAASPMGAPVAEIPPAAARDESASESADGQGWLRELNKYRAMAGLLPVRADPELSAGGFAHARYLVKNRAAMVRAGRIGVQMHSEDRDNRWYSPQGLRAARSGDVEEWSIPHGAGTPPPGWAITQWVGSAWHRLWILNPALRQVGYGQYCEGGFCVAVLDVLSSLRKAGLTPAAARAPIEFPPAGASVPISSLGPEWPNPLSACRGFTMPVGLPITLQLGTMVPARLSAFSLSRGATAETLEACGFDASSYVNPNPIDQDRARTGLNNLGAVVVIPRKPLSPGNYWVEMTVNGHSYKWIFSVAEDAD